MDPRRGSWRVLYCENTPGAACSWVE